MTNLIDIKKGLIVADSKRRKHLWIFVCATLVAVLGIALLMLKSKENYTLNMVFTILIAVIYLLYLVFYFTVLRRRLVDEYRFFDGAFKADLYEEKFQPIEYLEQTKISDGIEYYVLKVKVIGVLADTEKNYLIKDKFEFDSNLTYKVNLFGTVAISYEVVK